MRYRIPWILLASLAAAACTDSTSPTIKRAIQVTIVTTGIDVDADGYHVTVDQRAPVVVAANDTMLLNLPEGRHTVRLSDLAGNCVHGGTDRLEVMVVEGQPAVAAFQVTCGGVTGILRVEAVTAGDAADPDGYLINVTSPAPGNTMSLPTNGHIEIPGLIGGAYQVTISGLASSCAVSGGATRQATVVTGHLTRETAHATFNVTCLGAVAKITTATSGFDLDADYTLSIDGGQPNVLPPNDSLEVSLVAGDHTFLLGDVAPNCTVQGPNPVTATTGQGSVTVISFAVLCLRSQTAMRISGSMTGASLDTAIQITVDLVCDPWYYYYCDVLFQGPLPLDGSSVLVTATPGLHNLLVTDVAPNCTVVGGTTRSVSLPVGDTLDVLFAITCFAAGTIRVTTATTGSLPDDSYVLFLDGQGGVVVPANGAMTLDLVNTGQHTLLLYDVAVTCQVNGTNPMPVNVAADLTTDVVFQVACDPDASLVITAPTSGGDLDDTYLVIVDQSTIVALPATGSVTVPVYGGVHSVLLSDVAFNCQVSGLNPAPVAVPPSGTASVSFPVICTRYTGTARFTITTSGPNQPGTLLLDYACYYYYGCSQLLVPANGVASVDLGPGIYQFSFANIPSNCSVAPATSVQMNIAVGVTTDAAFTLACQ